MKASTSANMASAPTTSKVSLHWPGGMFRRPAFRCSSCEHALGRYESAGPFFVASFKLHLLNQNHCDRAIGMQD